MKFRSLIACLLFMAVSIEGQGQDRNGLSLPQLWEQAFANYPVLDVYRSQQRRAGINEKLIRNQYLPDVHLQAQNTFGTQNAMSVAFFPQPGLGVISERTVSKGALAGANEEPLFTLAQQDRLRLTIAIPEKHAHSVSDSTEIKYRIRNYPNEIFTAKMSRSSRVLDKAACNDG